MTEEIQECYRILDLDPSASPEAVKEAYRGLMKVWHPDRFPDDPKFQEKANEKTKQLNEAYERISAYLFRDYTESRASGNARAAEEAREAAEAERRRQEERQREEAQRRERERQRAEAQRVEGERRRRAEEEQAARQRRKPRFLMEPQDGQTVEGKPITLQAKADGVPSPSYEWFTVDRDGNGHAVANATGAELVVQNPPLGLTR